MFLPVFSVNPHEVKHWIDPNIIPYGWGLFKEEDEIKVEDKGQDTGQNIDWVKVVDKGQDTGHNISAI
jgi:hypothetical protein